MKIDELASENNGDRQARIRWTPAEAAAVAAEAAAVAAGAAAAAAAAGILASSPLYLY